jgi:hypothetical protein
MFVLRQAIALIDKQFLGLGKNIFLTDDCAQLGEEIVVHLKL